MVQKNGAIYEVSWELVATGLRAIGVLPMDSQCEVHKEAGEQLVIKVLSGWLPRVSEGQAFSWRKGQSGNPQGEAV